jgi:hypothetical protein
VKTQVNIESTNTATATKTTDTSASSSTTATKNEDSTSFKEQLESVKTQEAKTAEDTKTSEEAKTAQQTKAEETTKNNLIQQTEKDKLAAEEKAAAKNAEITDPVKELSTKIAALSEIKNGSSKTQGSGSKINETSDKNDHCQTLKMDNKDITFFTNLVENQQMSAQNAQVSGANGMGNNLFTDIKTEATQQTVQVSSALLDALNDSAKTGKSVRIDFGSDVAVIMKVDKEGVLSANFIPGSAAVETYLKNNIASLRQSFDEQNLPYNELSYNKQQKQEQQQQKQNNKENEDE